MEKKFTKGDWFVSGCNEVVSMPSQCKITNRVSGWNPEEAKANAKLIAASPELLEALIALVNGCLSDSESDKVVSLRKAKQIIKKATE